MRKFYLFLVILLLVSLVVNCSSLSTREQRVLSGGAIGAGAGAVISIIAGSSIAVGSAIGAAAGALGGLIYDESQRRKK